MSFSHKSAAYFLCCLLLSAFAVFPARAEILREALLAAWLTNPQLQAARQSFFSASTDVQSAFAGWLPQADLRVDYGVNQSSNTHDPTAQGATRTKNTRNPWSASVAVTQNIFQGGQIIGRFKQAKYLREAAYGDFLSAEQNVLLGAVSAYFNLLRDEAIVRLNRSNTAIFRERLSETRNRFRVGEGTRTLVAFAEAGLSLAKTQLIAAEAQQVAARQAYRRIIGRDSATKLSFPKLPPLPQSEKQARLSAQQRHPILIAARERYEAARIAKTAAYGLFLPNVSVEGLYTQGEELTDQTDKTTNLSVTGRVTLPLFRGGSSFATVRKAAHEAERARFGLLDQTRQINEMVANAWQSFHTARAQIAAASEEVRARRIALAGVRQEQSLGTGTFLDSLDAEQDYLNAQVSLATARRDEHVAAYNLLAAAGLLTAERLKLTKGKKK